MNQSTGRSTPRPLTASVRIARWRPRALAALALIAAVLSVAVISATAQASGGRIARFLLRADEQPGFTRFGGPTVVTSLRTFLRTLYVDHGRRFRADLRRLRAEGFSGAAHELLQADNGRSGFSLVIELATPAAARAETRILLSRAYRNNHGAAFTAFRVPGVPSARGVRALGGPQPGGTANVYWVEGRCAFGSGDYVPLAGSPLSRPVIAGAQALARRTGGHCP